MPRHWDPTELFRLWHDLEQTSSTSVIRRLPSLLTRGASPLEIARQTGEGLGAVTTLLTKLTESGVVESQSTGATLPEASRVYHLTSEGALFFRELAGTRTSE